ncbi:MAG: hypothetical protein Q8Q32_00595 [bacterium]|nr:hypothetical protein [bacterium]
MDEKFPKQTEGGESPIESIDLNFEGSRKEAEFEFRGQKYSVVIDRGSGVTLRESSEEQLYVILYGNEKRDSGVNVRITLTKSQENKVLAEMMILKVDEQKALPKGIGIAFYEKIIDALQGKADALNLEISHTVTRDDTLSKDKWNALFREMLEGRGYERILDNDEGLSRWEKVYKPQE